MYEQSTLQQPQVSSASQYPPQSIAGGQFDQSRQQYASVQQPQQAAGVPQYATTDQQRQQTQLDQQRQQQALAARSQQVGQEFAQPTQIPGQRWNAATQQSIPSQQLGQPTQQFAQPAFGEQSLVGATQSAIPQQASVTGQVPQFKSEQLPVQQFGSQQIPVQQATQSIPSQGSQFQEIPVDPMTGASQQSPIAYGRQTTEGIEQSRQAVEMADTGTLADVLARRLGLTSQQLAQVVPQLGMALGRSQFSATHQQVGTQQGVPSGQTQQSPAWLQTR